MRKNKILAFTTSILMFAAIAVPAAFAAEVDLPEATFAAETETENVDATNDAAELQKQLTALRADLSEMQNGMKLLQAKVVEAEMNKLKDQLAALQKEIAANEETNYTNDFSTLSLSANILDATSTSTPSTPVITRIEDFTGFDLDLETEEETNEAENSGEVVIEDNNSEDEKIGKEDGVESETAERLAAAEEEIEKLKEALEEKIEFEKEVTAHAEIKEKAAEIKSTEIELAETVVSDAIAKLRSERTSGTKTSNIIASADDELLFQFPRSLSQKTSSNNLIAAKEMTATILDAAEAEENFKRSSAPKNYQIISANSLTFLVCTFGAAILVFIAWLLHHEKKLLAATSRRFQQLELRPNFELKSRAKNKRAPRGKNIIR